MQHEGQHEDWKERSEHDVRATTAWNNCISSVLFGLLRAFSLKMWTFCSTLHIFYTSSPFNPTVGVTSKSNGGASLSGIPLVSTLLDVHTSIFYIWVYSNAHVVKRRRFQRTWIGVARLRWSESRAKPAWTLPSVSKLGPRPRHH